MSAKRRRPTFGMHHLTVVPRNAEGAAAQSDDPDEGRRDDE
ncbi:hypothetical protein N0B31_01395 [Salinirubellus salinus]|jgi:hypothetical protein|uniref:Uncharacterized protein n=1 Tax=Salinirubellus salinus TaxID=1364945 RepID=A0A9E7U512_9EURY|nr:hypothetical protein [Salinirubellus salinus]UWM54945.1 hypothetical protein N0B31_01395 [Salinirubellus salinus]